MKLCCRIKPQNATLDIFGINVKNYKFKEEINAHFKSLYSIVIRSIPFTIT